VVAILSSSFGAVIVAAGRWTADRRSDEDAGMAGTARKSAADLLEAARSVIQRVAPETAWAASGAGEALIVDIRSDDERRRDGIVPASLHVPRTVLEWRVDPESGWSNRHVVATQRRLILLCAHGWSSSFAAATLVDLGYRDAGDVEGGFEAWVAAGLPTASATERPAGVLPGMAPPD
jgi:rhodanese-related sulfurtransferase